MWVVCFFLSFLILALAIPLLWSLAPSWHAASRTRCIRCPETAKSVSIRLDPWYAVKMHALGNPEFRLQDCTEWPERSGCGQECLVRIAAKY